MSQNLIKILAISGSLRSNSSTNIVLNTVAKLVPPYVEFKVYDGLAELPHFNDSNDVPASVQNLRTLLSSSEGVLICML